MKRTGILLLLILFTHILSAQILEINGNLVIEDASPAGARIIISRNGERIDQKNIDRKGRFSVKFALDADYRIAFEKEGYITKTVSVRTEVPEEIIESNPNFPPIKLIINLLPVVEGVDLSIFEQPVAILAYNYELDDFSFDSDYSRRIKDKIASTEREIKRIYSQRGAEIMAREKEFAGLVNKGNDHFSKREWEQAIENWNKALGMKPDNKDLPPKITEAKNEAEKELQTRLLAEQRERNYNNLIKSADSLSILERYPEAILKYKGAIALNHNNQYPEEKIKEIENLTAEKARLQQEENARKQLTEKYNLLISQGDQAFQRKGYSEAENNYREALSLNYNPEYPRAQLQKIETIRKEEADRLQQENEQNARYAKLIAEADLSFKNKEYSSSIEKFNTALTIKPAEIYPKEMIVKAQARLDELERLARLEEEKRKQEEMRRKELMSQYQELITKADASFSEKNYNLAKNYYLSSEKLNTGETYPRKKIEEIEKIINSSKYKQQLKEFEKNVESAEKALTQKNYAGAKVYYQNALTILPIDQDDIRRKIDDINQIIERERTAAIEKEYKEHITKADNALKDKSYAIARFYYQKALEVKKEDQYAREKLSEVEKNISDRTEKTVEL